MFHTHRLIALLPSIGLLVACATTHELNIDRPVAKAAPLQALPGAAGVDGDEFYVQLVSEPLVEREADWKQSCREIGSGYAKGAATSMLMFQVRNDALHFNREVPGFLFQSASGRCSSSMDAKKAYLSPWMRLDAGKDTQIDYRYVKSNSGGLDVGKIGSDVNTASNVLALSGVGTGVALMGKVASGWMMNSSQPSVQTADPGRSRQETRSLPPPVQWSGTGASLTEVRFPVYETTDSKFNPLSSKPQALGELRLYADVKSSLLLKIGSKGLPDARDLSLDELWRSTIQNGAGGLSLQKFIADADHPERPNLQPDWGNYRDVELNCRKLKVVMKDLGFNKFDRNAVLYYFLDKTSDWRNYNITGQSLLGGTYRLAQLQQYRARNFGGCLIQDDFETMKRMGLAVNADQDWANALQQVAEKESYFGAIHSVERQLAAVLRNPNLGEMERQAFPLIASRQGGSGTVLLQNNLGNFGLEQLLNVPAIPGEGLVVTAQQLAQAFTGLKVADLSCARPAFEQGRPLRNVAILLFATAPDSPLSKGAALEFEFDGGRIIRLALQSPAFRDFRQDIVNLPDIGDCRIDGGWLQRL